MRTVGRPSKASALKGQAWAPILNTELLSLLHDGLGSYFDRWQEDLNKRTLEKVEKDLKDWFGGNLDSATERSALKKLNNSASAPGTAGFLRTLQALNEFPKFKELSGVKSSANFEKIYSKFAGGFARKLFEDMAKICGGLAKICAVPRRFRDDFLYTKILDIYYCIHTQSGPNAKTG
jgi:hypothetical protein